MSKKVLIYSAAHTNVWGGGQIYIEQLCVYMNANGVETYILTSNPESFACPTMPMPIAHPKYKRLTHAFSVAKRYRDEGFERIILNDLPSLWLAPIFKAYGYRVISLLHLYLRRREGKGLGHRFLPYHLLRLTSRFCDAIFSVNRDNAAVFGKQRVTFAGNYVPEWFFAAPREEEKTYDFILIARFSVEKNLPLFLELLYRLNRQGDRRFNALLVGKGPEKGRIEERIDALGLSESVTIREWVERRQLPAVYDLGRCFVISSYHEGFATTLLEAHARGVPAIVTRSSGFCGSFVEGYNSETGLVFAPEDLENEAFLAQVTRLIDGYEAYAVACKQKAKQFSEAKVLGPIMEATQG